MEESVASKFDSNITFLLFSNNEEKRIESMLKCLKGHGEIILIDNFSIDNTVSIARNYTNKIYQFRNIGYVENEATMKFACSLASNKWVYLAYADELIPKKLMSILKNIARDSSYQIIEIYRKNFMYGQEVFNYGKHHLRMFIKGDVDFKNNVVHKLGVYKSNAKVLRIKKTDDTNIWHFSPYNCDRIEMVHNRYANIEAMQLHHISKKKFSGSRILFKLFFYFFGTYFGLGGYRGGWPGFFLSVQISYYKFSIEARLWEIDNGVTQDWMESQYQVIQSKFFFQNNNSSE
jgi:glycosyltransferase involved in cell wall biosynthesis